jgi:hypothetical protein
MWCGQRDEGLFRQQWSLGDIILHLRVYDKKSPLYNTSLFHSIDYVEDTSKLWIDGAEDPEAQHTFSCFTRQYKWRQKNL